MNIRAIDYDDDLQEFLKEYNYQPLLTKKLDGINGVLITQNLINEIVLWKVNRYVLLNDNLFSSLNKLVILAKGEHRKGEEVLSILLQTNGVDLPMASTILRFRNPKVFQIIDRHAYRALYSKKYPLYPGSPAKRKIREYFDYMDALITLCDKRGLDFQYIDRLLYIFDKKKNGKL